MHVHRLAVATVAVKNSRDDDELLFGHKVPDASLVLGGFVAVYGVKVELEGCGEGREECEELHKAEKPVHGGVLSVRALMMFEMCAVVLSCCRVSQHGFESRTDI